MNESQIFNRALLLAGPAERAAFLDGACGDNPQLRADVEALLQVHAKAPDFLEAPAAVSTVDAPSRERLGTIIGPYKLLQEIGEGGMGTVFMAEQSEPVKRMVALKIVKPGMDSRQVIARFEAERQALAMMDHPNIAKVYDAGQIGEPSRVSDRVPPPDAENRGLTPLGSPNPGRPYFVMELVKGVPITKYCDDHNLTPKERLELFIPVCHAVQHAHQKGIIHRDLKPSNVMVACYDDKPVPKVIDFGIAKATGQKLTERTLFTQFGQLVGTLEYMSPEQATLNALDIDTRSDIYSLGVLLYELLTGSTPLEKKRLKETPFDEILRLIREEETPTPSTRLLSTAELPAIAAQRKTEPAKLSRLVRGDLDWIAMKALDKDRNRRYETANAFAADVERYLHDEPVEACPPSAAYRLRKFVRRQKVALVITACVLLALAGVAGGIGWAVRDRLASQEETQREETERRAKLEIRGQDAMMAAKALLHDNQPDLARLRLDVAKGLIGSDRAAFAELASDIDAFDADLTRYQRFLELIDKGHRPLGPNERTSEFGFLIEAMQCYDVLQHDDWPARLERSVLGKKQVEQIRSTVYEELLWLANAGLVLRVGDLRVRKQSPPKAAAESTLRYLRAAEQARPATHGLYAMRAECHAALKNEKEARADEERARQTPPTRAIDFYHKGDRAFHAGNRDEALKWFEAALSVEPSHFWSMLMLGFCLFNDPQKGPDNIRAAVVAFTGCIMKRPDYPLAYANRAAAYRQLGRLPEAVVDDTKAIELYPGALTWGNRGTTYEQLGLSDKAIADYAKALEFNLSADSLKALDGLVRLRKKLMQSELLFADLDKTIIRHSNWVPPLNRRAELYEKFGQWEMAIGDHSKIIELYSKNSLAWPALYKRGFIYHKLGKADLVLADYTKVKELWTEDIKQFPKNPARYNVFAWRLATDIDPDFREPRQAVEWAKEAVKMAPTIGTYWNTLGAAHYYAGDWQPSVDALKQAMELGKGGSARDWFFLAMAHWKLGNKDKAQSEFDRAVKWMDANEPRNEEFRRFRAEAAQLLGIKDQPKAPK